MTTLYDSARSLLVHYDRLLPPGLAPAKVRRKIQIRGQAHVAFRLCAGAFDGPAHGRRRGGHVEPRQHRHSGAFCHGADCCGQHARRVRRAKAAAHRPPRPPRRCSRQRSGSCARKGRRLGRENVFYHPADGRCRDAARRSCHPPRVHRPTRLSVPLGRLSCSRSVYHAGAHRLFHGAGRQHCPHSAQRGGSASF